MGAEGSTARGWMPREDGEAPVLVRARGLQMHFPAETGVIARLTSRRARRAVRAVDGVDLALGRGESYGLVGESGCGKSTLGMTLVRLYEPTGGDILLNGVDITHAAGATLRALRRRAQIVFQDPYGSLNPRRTAGWAVEEPLRIHRVDDPGERARRVVEALERARLSAADYLHRYPHQLSGGERQRVAIARAIVLRPELIVADEPTSMLDVSLRAGILDLLQELADELDLAVLHISHDVATLRYASQRVGVMYLGVLVEHGGTQEVIGRPAHPYTQKLVEAVPVPDPTYHRPVVELPGEVPSAIDPPSGCRFRTRCPFAMDVCRRVQPGWTEVGPGHYVACHLYGSEENQRKGAEHVDVRGQR